MTFTIALRREKFYVFHCIVNVYAKLTVKMVKLNKKLNNLTKDFWSFDIK